ncbi:MAG TPA: IS1634 family transposase [Steroidobacteraceae bacterium]|nr:IS1634 family transposase [Steroidobacteraceae bacterium]
MAKEQVPWAKMMSVLVAARLCEPSSELHIAEDWYRRTALSDLLQLSPEQVNKDRLYRALDELLVHKGAIEAHLSRRCGELFSLDQEVLLYDVTSTYFEGEAAGNALAARGYSRDHRPDCKQVCIALVVSFDGFPLGYEVFPGNMNDARTVEKIVTTMEARHGVIGRVWIADRGMSSRANLSWLRCSGRRYIIGAAKSELKKHAPLLAETRGWRTLREGVEVRLTRCAETGDTVVLARSAERRDKERAMHEKFARRIEVGLARLAERIERARRPLDRDTIQRQIGRLLQVNQRAAARYEITLLEAKSAAGFHLNVKINEAFDEWTKISEGAYALKTNLSDWSDEKLWRAYIQLAQAEAAFRVQKDELSIRPIWHQRADRVEAHILVCFLAFVLWKTLELWQRRAELGNSPRTVLEEIKRIHCHDVCLPTTTHGEITLRCVTQPDDLQSMLLDRLGITLPKRLRIDQTSLPIALSA